MWSILFWLVRDDNTIICVTVQKDKYYSFELNIEFHIEIKDWKEV